MDSSEQSQYYDEKNVLLLYRLLMIDYFRDSPGANGVSRRLTTDELFEKNIAIHMLKALTRPSA